VSSPPQRRRVPARTSRLSAVLRHGTGPLTQTELPPRASLPGWRGSRRAILKPMAPTTAERLADEIANGQTQWSIYGARFACDVAPPGPTTGIAIDHVWCELGPGLASALEYRGRSPSKIRAAAKAARDAGYVVGGRKGWFFARRPLREREIFAEVARIEGVARDPMSICTFPRRVPRPRLTGTPFPAQSVDRIRGMAGWRWEWAGVSRHGPTGIADTPGWQASATCSVLVDDGETSVDFFVDVFARRSTSPNRRELQAVSRRLHECLKPLGYKGLTWKRSGTRLIASMYKRGVSGLAEARRHRGRIDRIIFSG
jgi:hypothetical protein